MRVPAYNSASKELDPAVSEARIDGDRCPKITVVTPSYNQGAFIEDTITSVLDQGYPNLEYIIMDGGSSDDTVDIIRRYADKISYWTSEPDGGAAAALAAGFARATGDILAYLNSDDTYQPGALQTIATILSDPDTDVAYGNLLWMDTEGRITGERRQTRFSRMGYLFGASDLMQPATFWTRAAYESVGGINSEYRFAFDTDLFFRFASGGARFTYVPQALAAFRIHDASKSTNQEEICALELSRLRGEHLPVPFNSIRGRLIRTGARIQRAICYSLQGDGFWLLSRIPDRLTAPWASEIVGPRGRRV